MGAVSALAVLVKLDHHRAFSVGLNVVADRSLIAQEGVDALDDRIVKEGVVLVDHADRGPAPVLALDAGMPVLFAVVVHVEGLMEPAAAVVAALAAVEGELAVV